MGAIPLEAAGFADAAGFGAVVWVAYFVLCGALAIAAGVLLTRALLAPRPSH